jgi:hypothetical protein
MEINNRLSYCDCCGSYMTRHKVVAKYSICEMCFAKIHKNRRKKLAEEVLKTAIAIIQNGTRPATAIEIASHMLGYDKKPRVKKSHNPYAKSIRLNWKNLEYGTYDHP